MDVHPLDFLVGKFIERTLELILDASKILIFLFAPTGFIDEFCSEEDNYNYPDADDSVKVHVFISPARIVGSHI